ncbi:diphthine--ammonia ligase [Pseudalkalibacillus caeni]|uniref:Diphthine--ammonia ligase n=1 Tax=Exobacillus caeni TaxID=2574798 RepID=A0A5R9F4A8_9BACL|nr:diphthine--ammonia ligase [Pseudalkalibacillus caeni]TLS37851.1 diphthine--ammonia ligase [Pseudalkalibacillus caeni]
MCHSVVFSWSSGKDSALALYLLQKENRYQVEGLWTTVQEQSDSVAFHGVSVQLIKEQALKLMLPIKITTLPDGCSNERYEALVGNALGDFKNRVNNIAFGDIFLEDIKEFRENTIRKSCLKPIFPLWKQDTKKLAETFFSLGFEAVITTVDTDKVAAEWIGKKYDEGFVDSLPEDVDPCGENGEFHTFVINGPNFSERIKYKSGNLTRNGSFLTLELKYACE